MHQRSSARDLNVDLDAIAAWDAIAVITLMESHELTTLGVDSLGTAVGDRMMAWVHIPMPDGGVPDSGFQRRWTAIWQHLGPRLDRDARVLIHCKGGLGRTGLLAARILIDREPLPTDVADDSAPFRAQVDRIVATVRDVRPGAVETPAQLRWLHDTTLKHGRERMSQRMTVPRSG